MSTQPRVLVVEDEIIISEILRDYLIADGFAADVINTGEGVVDFIRDEHPDLVLLDLMLPEVDGVRICREVRAFSDVPIIMVTAKIDEADCLIGLGVGADDYVCKPVKPKEVVARVKAILRRTARLDFHAQAPQSALQIDDSECRARWHQQIIDLTPIEFRLLALFAKKIDRVYSRDTLMSAIYLDGRYVSDRTVDSHVKNLRRKLIAVTQLDNPIRPVYGMGYKLELNEKLNEK